MHFQVCRVCVPCTCYVPFIIMKSARIRFSLSRKQIQMFIGCALLKRPGQTYFSRFENAGCVASIVRGLRRCREQWS